MHTGKTSSLRVIIFVMFFAVALSITTSVAGYNAYMDEVAAHQMADIQLSKQCDKVILESSRLLDPAYSTVAMLGTTNTQLTDEPPAALSPQMQEVQLLLNILKRYPQLTSIYAGYDSGEFFEVISFIDGEAELRQGLTAPDNALFGLHNIRTEHLNDATLHTPVHVESWVWLAEDHSVIGNTAERVTEYDPRVRPWYTRALTSHEIIQTGYYVFAPGRELGFTVARRFGGEHPGVFAVDMTVHSISQFLQQQETNTKGLVFLFTEDGTLTGYPDPHKVVHRHPPRAGVATHEVSPVMLDSFDDPVAAKAYSLFRQQGEYLHNTFTVQGEEWIARVTPLPDQTGLAERKEYVAVAVPLHNYTRILDQIRLESLFFATTVMLCIIPLLLYLSRRISNPLTLLADEMDEIRHFRLGSKTVIRSRIKEVAELTTAFDTMRHTLGAFTRYLPKALVRQFVLSGIEPVLGGERRELSLLFSDVADFTRLSEHAKAETLMLKMSRYFQVLGTPVLESGGTIDKYIGDGMMAFWNAPLPQEDHALRACEAALRCQTALKEQNAQWQAEGRNTMVTRFGLHAGECIVGNVGTSDRMNYTAIGAAVNIASRLEGLNKLYGTGILVSGSIEEKARSAFVFRSVDIASPRGTTDPVQIFELLGTRIPLADGTTCPPIQTDDALAEWETAMAEYRSMQFHAAFQRFSMLQSVNTDDRLAALYLERCRDALSNPPEPDWSPVVHHS
ncbi:adenylate/guanylate cyclase domain-containing protein [Desulfovibrio mangrovi]|uniref:adenylate/guanylate cyclase domain-containing protein n=1 Tax=Desulfovibrio mangrovi TaxID=2976983 RepID=UPI0022450005|nr:adenylate/guanylate cyclase domain-containing protein [Desulfovibrio mangrovi]UZP66538.1 adenylate/guanylate cyclase domain-containing protein [Desulfovibrio mangrovi]